MTSLKQKNILKELYKIRKQKTPINIYEALNRFLENVHCTVQVQLLLYFEHKDNGKLFCKSNLLNFVTQHNLYANMPLFTKVIDIQIKNWHTTYREAYKNIPLLHNMLL